MPTISSCGDVALDGRHARAERTARLMSIRHPQSLEETPHGLRVLFHDAPAALLSRDTPHLRELLTELTRQQPPRPLRLDVNDPNHITGYRLVLRAVVVDVRRDELAAILHSNAPRYLRCVATIRNLPRKPSKSPAFFPLASAREFRYMPS
jgi:hypothetical protein